MNGRMTRRLFVLLCTAVSALADWTELTGCRLVENGSNDGDSFLIESPVPYRGETVQRYRLYFVDTAETDSNSPFKLDRLKDQAAYWGSDDPDFALQMGLRAEQTVKKWMRSSFTVYTQGEYAPSLGAPRCYALIRIGDCWLDEMLVEEGLARIFGSGSDLPDGTSADSHRSRLQTLERSARADSRNGWRYASCTEEQPDVQKKSEFQPHDTVTVRDAWIYSLKTGAKAAVLPKGSAVSVLEESDGTRLRVRFKLNGKVYEGLCEKQSLKR
jgi:hypothetical protein